MKHNGGKVKKMLVKKIERGEDLRREFEAYNRGDNFSYCACDALAEYFNEFDENIELDVLKKR